MTNILYILFRVALEILVLIGLLDLLAVGTSVTMSNYRKQNIRAALIAVVFTVSVVLAFILRLYVIGPQVEL